VYFYKLQVLIFLVHVIHLFYLLELKGVWHGIDWDNPQGVVFTQGPQVIDSQFVSCYKIQGTKALQPGWADWFGEWFGGRLCISRKFL